MRSPLTTAAWTHIGAVSRDGSETSLHHASRDARVAHGRDTAHDARQRIRADRQSHWDLLCVVDDDGRLIGTLSAPELLTLPDDAVLSAHVRRDRPSVASSLDQEHTASVALHHAVSALPVVDAEGRVVGVVGAQKLMDILRREHVEDLHRLAGISRETAQARQALEAPPLRRARHRLPWLIFGLVGSALATFVMSRFEASLAALPALAFFVPGLVYMADAIGTQSEAIAVRGLSLSRISLARLIGSELRTGLLIGCVLSALAFLAVWAVFGQPRLAGAVALALAAASVVASAIGLTLPWLLSRLGTDPAYGSGPLATIVQDVLSLLIYFGCVHALVLS